MKIIHILILHLKKSKYLGINLTKKVKALYNESIKTLKDTENNVKRWKVLSWACVDRFNIVYMVILPKTIEIIRKFYINSPIKFFPGTEEQSIKFCK